MVDTSFVANVTNYLGKWQEKIWNFPEIFLSKYIQLSHFQDLPSGSICYYQIWYVNCYSSIFTVIAICFYQVVPRNIVETAIAVFIVTLNVSFWESYVTLFFSPEYKIV